MNSKLAIYGAGGFGRETAAMISQINDHDPTWEVIGFFDDGLKRNKEVDGLKILGGIDDLNSYSQNISVCVAVADPVIRFNLINKITNKRISFPTIIHPSAIPGDKVRNEFGRGCIITAGVIFTTGIKLGDFCIVNLTSTVGHDVKLGDCCTVMPGCSISGNVTIGKCSLLGTGSRIIQGITTGENCMIGAGAVVTKSFGSNLKILGVPAHGRKLGA